jgi:hypothetical protein
MATCSEAIPAPIKNNETIATQYAGNRAKLKDPSVPTRNAATITGFSVNRSTRKPAGIDITP